MSRSITPEMEPWLEGFDLRRQVELVERVREAGYRVEALPLSAWLALKAAGVRDVTAATTRAKYRRILAELGPPNRQPRRPKRAMEGQASLFVIAATAAATTAAAVGPHALVALAHVIPPIILDQPVMSGEERRAA